MKYIIFIVLLLLSIPVVAIMLLVTSAPNVQGLRECLTTRMNSVYLCPSSHNYVPLGEISNDLKNSILLSEDASFYGHKGFDWSELRASLELNIKKFKIARGGSTITQQLAKNVYLTKKKTLGRKIREAYLAHQIEELMTKDQIYERYLNVIEYGENIFGIKQAANYYFSKLPADLNILESAFLAFLLPNPKVYAVSHRKGHLTQYARHRILEICKRLLRFKRISEEQLSAAVLLVDRFPWRDLSTEELRALKAGTADFDQPFPEDAHEREWLEPLEELIKLEDTSAETSPEASAEPSSDSSTPASPAESESPFEN